MNKHTFFAHANRTALSVCKLILIITAFLSTASLAQEQTPVDLSIHSMARTSTTVGSGQDIEYQVYVRILQPKLGASGVILTADLPEGVTFSSVRVKGGECSYADNRVTCNMTYPPELEGILIDYNTLIQIYVKPTRTGGITFTAQIKANEPDPNLSNNTTSSTFNVVKSRKRVRFF